MGKLSPLYSMHFYRKALSTACDSSVLNVESTQDLPATVLLILPPQASIFILLMSNMAFANKNLWPTLHNSSHQQRIECLCLLKNILWGEQQRLSLSPCILTRSFHPSQVPFHLLKVLNPFFNYFNHVVLTTKIVKKQFLDFGTVSICLNNLICPML